MALPLRGAGTGLAIAGGIALAITPSTPGEGTVPNVDNVGEVCKGDDDPCKGPRRQLAENGKNFRTTFETLPVVTTKDPLGSRPQHANSIIRDRIGGLKNRIRNLEKLLREYEKKNGQ